MSDDDYPRIESSIEDVGDFFEQLRKHTLDLVKHELDRHKLGKDKEAYTACKKAIDEWVSSAKLRLEPNLSGNSLPHVNEDAKTQPFDKVLSKQVQELTEEADELTEQVMEARKTIPSRRAAALQARFKVIESIRNEAEEQRRIAEEEFDSRIATEADRPKVTLERAEQIGETLESAVRDIENLAVTLLEQSSAAQEQAKFVKRLRTMSASYS